uniref:Predicted protein n=1 Tax=Hordeum vulgare subsp. vulgare TaxID=112509 RepID=F2CUX6_HORVV|nr:predicted protein [Hordeum vulgare subsp. vulgare]
MEGGAGRRGRFKGRGMAGWVATPTQPQPQPQPQRQGGRGREWRGQPIAATAGVGAVVVEPVGRPTACLPSWCLWTETCRSGANVSFDGPVASSPPSRPSLEHVCMGRVPRVVCLCRPLNVPQWKRHDSNTRVIIRYTSILAAWPAEIIYSPWILQVCSSGRSQASGKPKRCHPAVPAGFVSKFPWRRDTGGRMDGWIFSEAAATVALARGCREGHMRLSAPGPQRRLHALFHVHMLLTVTRQ